MEKVAELLQDPWVKEFLPRPALLQFTAHLAAALGNSALFDQALGEVEENVRSNLEHSLPPMLVPLGLLGNAAPVPSAVMALEMHDLLQKDILYPQLRERIVLRTTRGLILLETGDIAKAADHFRAALSWAPADADFPEEEMARRYLYWIERAQHD
jgi:hypothetical protein